MGQKLQTLNREQRVAIWAERITACRSSAMTVRAWCQEQQVSEKTYYYWQRRIFGMVAEQQPAFAEITPPQANSPDVAAVTIRMNGAKVDVHNGADSATVEAVLQALKSC